MMLLLRLINLAPERIMSSIVSINGAPSSIKILPDMYEVVTGLARTTQLVGVPLIDVNLNIDTFYSRKLKEVFRINYSAVAVVFCLPFWLIVAVIIKIDSRGPIFYKQSRTGLNGKLFKIIKFRSMVLMLNQILVLFGQKKKIQGLLTLENFLEGFTLMKHRS